MATPDITITEQRADEAAHTPEAPQDAAQDLDALVSFASALLDLDRLRVVAALSAGPANRMRLAELTGLSHRDLLRHIDSLQHAGLVRLQPPAARQPDQYSPYELDQEAFTAARRAMGKYKGVKPRPTDQRLLTLETFMPGGKLNAFPRKNEQIVVILDEVARKFEPERQYAEREVNGTLEEINEDYCTLRRLLVDYGYLSRTGGIYTRNG
jgi:predicted transcriptional regulator